MQNILISKSKAQMPTFLRPFCVAFEHPSLSTSKKQDFFFQQHKMTNTHSGAKTHLETLTISSSYLLPTLSAAQWQQRKPSSKPKPAVLVFYMINIKRHTLTHFFYSWMWRYYSNMTWYHSTFGCHWFRGWCCLSLCLIKQFAEDLVLFSFFLILFTHAFLIKFSFLLILPLCQCSIFRVLMLDWCNTWHAVLSFFKHVRAQPNNGHN